MGVVIKTGEAKTRLSELLARVEAGEEVTIARGDVPVARLVPIARRDNAHAAVADIMAARAGLAATTADELIAWRDEARR
ncbi:type II toxin-antitoxin system Phd/YefM family antitoxin [Roseovarius sp. M141]|uniref:type II toxin-antitoxin system Phd/YefM family antitoxin n=1 Tax=Roseovarius sp. M141 TaxID=2583806 RepID=UPI0020CCBC0A|nr:type II toxin-antitoxin system prevent-host-death family antitoxin [Roseovarius sp. M141]MCQ0090279.1 type II toxin-antitoxin system prevent-host-death family antitoxin [Roseovarius sp. M141]